MHVKLTIVGIYLFSSLLLLRLLSDNMNIYQCDVNMLCHSFKHCHKITFYTHNNFFDIKNNVFLHYVNLKMYYTNVNQWTIKNPCQTYSYLVIKYYDNKKTLWLTKSTLKLL